MDSTLKKLSLMLSGLLLGKTVLTAQIPVEVFAGNRKATLDLMFFKYLKNSGEKNSRFLFFNRNRASVDYEMTTTTNLPQFGFTEAFSYNPAKLKGFAPVFVVQVFGSGVYPKAGFQYAYIKKEITIFTWLVSELRKSPNIDLFFLGRYTPALNAGMNLFSQLELVNAVPTSQQKNFAFTQRIRLGLKFRAFQFGLAADFSESGRTAFTNTRNLGGFLRYEF